MLDDPRQSLSSHGPKEIDASKGFEQTDASVGGIAVFLVSLLIFVGATGVLCYFIGHAFNAHNDKEDGPVSKWAQTVNVRQLGNFPSSPELQNRVAELTRSFPSPRVQLDNGDQDVADLHAREDLLLNYYSWIDPSKGTVRIPIERAMELVAQRGLPVMPAPQVPPPMTADARPHVTEPLTDGFARTAFELEAARQREAEARRRQ